MVQNEIIYKLNNYFINFINMRITFSYTFPVKYSKFTLVNLSLGNLFSSGNYVKTLFILHFILQKTIAFINHETLVSNHCIISQSCYYYYSPSLLVYSLYSVDTNSFKVYFIHYYHHYVCKSQSPESFVFSYTLTGHGDGLVPPSQSSVMRMSIGRGNFNTFQKSLNNIMICNVRSNNFLQNLKKSYNKLLFKITTSIDPLEDPRHYPRL